VKSNQQQHSGLGSCIGNACADALHSSSILPAKASEAGAKALRLLGVFLARLKPCPDYKALGRGVFVGCEVVPFQNNKFFRSL